MSISSQLGGHLVPFWIPTPLEYLQESYQQQRNLSTPKWVHVHPGRQVRNQANFSHLCVIFQFATAKEIGLVDTFNNVIFTVLYPILLERIRCRALLLPWHYCQVLSRRSPHHIFAVNATNVSRQ